MKKDKVASQPGNDSYVEAEIVCTTSDPGAFSPSIADSSSDTALLPRQPEWGRITCGNRTQTPG